MDLNTIANVVCFQYDITKEDLICKSRKREIVEPRQLFHYLARKFSINSLETIGKYKGGKFNHATVMHSIIKIKDFYNTYKPFRETVKKLETIIINTNMIEYRMTNENSNAIIKVKAESRNKALGILNEILESVEIPTIDKEGWIVKEVA